MRDPRIDDLASLLVDRSVGVEPGWQVFIRSTPLARPLVDAVQEQIARRGAYPILHLSWEMIGGPFAREAPLELLAKPAPLLLRAWEECDAFISITATENVREGSELSPERRRILQQRMEPLRRRQMAMEVPWVICEFPTNAAAQESGLTLHEYEEFVYGAVLRDWDAEGRRMAGIAALFDGAEEVRIVGERTDLKLSLAGRNGMIEDGHINMPGGEVFYSPIEDSAEGEITFCEFPAMYYGHEVSGVRLVFEAGQVVEASAATGEDFLLRTLDTDRAPGAWVSSESAAIPGSDGSARTSASTRRSTGQCISRSATRTPRRAARTSRSVHWDMVKDLHNGGQIFVDGRLAQEGGRWLTLEPAAG